LSGARGPGVRTHAGKGSYAGMAKAARVPAFAVPSRALTAALALLGCIALPATAAAQGGTGGAQPQASPTPAPAPKSAPAQPPVRSKITLTRLACASGCGANGAVRPGALLRVRGAGMRRTAEVHFDGAVGDADDVSAAPVKRRKTSVDVRVPLGAATGAVTVLDRDGVLTGPAPAPLTVEALPAATPAADGPSIDVDVQAPKAFFDAARPMRVSYVVHDDRAVDVRVELVREKDQAVIASWAPGVVQPETAQVVQWNGLAGGRVQKPGRYVFRVSAADEAGGLRASSAQVPSDEPAAPQEPDPASFRFLRHTFPIHGPHGYGEFAAKFGGGRGHQGQDVFAACGTPMVAARGGVVKFKQYHSRAGYYLVIDGERTGIDYAYMHLKSAALVDKGERVRTGQLIGYVGDTGDASGCHLHFEMWKAPGWYSGGAPFDPLPDLLGWDKVS
jgi:murein DD-endopeptidase MepM/ murein hydrolase activator NlpD